MVFPRIYEEAGSLGTQSELLRPRRSQVAPNYFIFRTLVNIDGAMIKVNNRALTPLICIEAALNHLN